MLEDKTKQKRKCLQVTALLNMASPQRSCKTQHLK